MTSPHPTSPARVISLLPSATETLCLLDAGHLLVGRSHECDYPTQPFPTQGHHRCLADVPVLTAARIHDDSPASIDQAVRASLAQGQSLYNLDTNRLAALQPDLIITQDLCDVCSIDLATVRRAAASLSPQPATLSLNPHTVEGVLDDVLRVSEALGFDAKGRHAGMHAVAQLRERLFDASEFVNPFADGPIVGFLEWTDPLFIAGHWTVQLIERAGGRHPLNPTVPNPTAGAAIGPQMAERRAGKSIRVPEDLFVATKPEYLIIAPCGLTLDQTRRCANELQQKPWWNDIPAVRQRNVALVDGNQMFNRPGPRLVDAFAWLVGWLNGRPELIPPNFPWEPMPT